MNRVAVCRGNTIRLVEAKEAKALEGKGYTAATDLTEDQKASFRRFPLSAETLAALDAKPAAPKADKPEAKAGASK